MTGLETIHLILGSSGLLGIVFLIFRTGRIVEKVDRLGLDLGSLKTEIKELRTDVADVKERVAFMESFVFFRNSRRRPTILGAKRPRRCGSAAR